MNAYEDELAVEIAKWGKGRTSQTINTMRGYFFKCGFIWTAE